MTQEQILEILDSYKLRIPPTVFYDLKADIVNYEEQEPTTKNDLPQERYQDLIEYFGDEKVAKTILESRKEFKAWLERLRWHVKRADELARELEQIKGTTKNNLGVDAVSRDAVLDLIADYDLSMGQVVKGIHALPSVTPQEPRTGHWVFVGEENEEETRNGDFRYICSECGYSDIHAKSTYVPYCWHCGAKMAEQEET